jgi:hypothetical protein
MMVNAAMRSMGGGGQESSAYSRVLSAHGGCNSHFLPFVLLSMCFQAFRKWYRGRPRIEKDEFATPLEARGLLIADDSRAEPD